jgi:hypothetical protein
MLWRRATLDVAPVQEATVPEDVRDTRDRVIRLETKVEHLVNMVERNSELIGEMHDLQQKAQGGLTVGKAILTAAKHVGFGSAGAGLIWVVQHFGVVK